MAVEVKVDHELWRKVNLVLLDENAGIVAATLIGGLCGLLTSIGVAKDDEQARIHLAAMVLSPIGAPVGSLIKRLQAEAAKIEGN